jgi:hypothetical protein
MLLPTFFREEPKKKGTTMTDGEGVTPAPSTLKRLGLNAWTWWGLAVTVVLIHGILGVLCNDVSWMQRGGGLVILCGVMAIARPVIRIGEAAFVESSLPRLGLFTMPEGSGRSSRDRLWPETLLDVRAIQIHGPILVGFGTVISAYGDLPFKALGCGYPCS